MKWINIFICVALLSLSVFASGDVSEADQEIAALDGESGTSASSTGSSQSSPSEAEITTVRTEGQPKHKVENSSSSKTEEEKHQEEEAAAEALRASRASLAAQTVHWSYCFDGPGMWESLDERYAVCGEGVSQSPINIVDSEVQTDERLKPLEFDYKESSAALLNTGKAWTVNYDPGSILTVDGDKQYELLSLEFHAPSEHQLNGKRLDMEIHLVHKSSDQDTIIVSVLVEEGNDNSGLARFWDAFPEHTASKTVPGSSVYASELIPKSKQYYVYRGSLTMPPCKEGVTHYVLKSPITASKAQIEKIKQSLDYNARPVQPLHGRSVKVSAYKEGANGEAEDSQEESQSNSDWSYCRSGPSDWAELNEYFDLCRDGEHQSPINIVKGNVKKSNDELPIKFMYKDSELVLMNSGHAIQINYDEGSFLEVKGEKYQLLQANFHTPSEHLIDNVPAAMEMHLVHKHPRTNALVFVCVLMQEGKENEILDSFWNSLPRSKITVDLKKRVDMNALVPATAPAGFYHYSGSLTSPPCSENIEWYVIQEPIQVSVDQIKAFQAIIPHNARPVAKLYGRQVTMPESGFVEVSSSNSANTETLANAAANAATKASDPTHHE